MRLFKVSTNKFHSYVCAKSFSDAQAALENYLNKTNYGFTGDRKVVNIELVADQVKYPDGDVDMLLFYDDYSEEKFNLMSKL